MFKDIDQIIASKELRERSLKDLPSDVVREVRSA
jgi:hypothetical protein